MKLFDIYDVRHCSLTRVATLKTDTKINGFKDLLGTRGNFGANLKTQEKSLPLTHVLTPFRLNAPFSSPDVVTSALLNCV